MFAKALLFTILGACGVASGAASDPEPTLSPSELERPDGHNEETVLEDQHFCCESVDTKNMSGEGCNAIGKESINSCPSVLYCPNRWGKDNGNVACD
jgi:hypothetical protein